MKTNIAELLKDCPRGMELDCASYDNVSFDKISDDKKAAYPIFCYITDKEGNRSGISFTENGCESKRYGAKCVIFPKGKTTWEGFVPPIEFKDGDVLYVDCTDKNDNKQYDYIFILDKIYNGKVYSCCFYYIPDDDFRHNLPVGTYLTDDKYPIRFATEEEKQKLFDAIKANGYKWNAETKTLEKLVEPKFKVGDRIRHKETNKDDVYEISKVYDDSYGLVGYTWMIYMNYQDQYELVPNKFDITTLKAFDKVLVRNTNSEVWRISLFGCFSNEERYFMCMANSAFYQCIPYNEDTKHLVGTADDCDDFYKTWEK